MKMILMQRSIMHISNKFARQTYMSCNGESKINDEDTNDQTSKYGFDNKQTNKETEAALTIQKAYKLKKFWRLFKKCPSTEYKKLCGNETREQILPQLPLGLHVAGIWNTTDELNHSTISNDFRDRSSILPKIDRLTIKSYRTGSYSRSSTMELSSKYVRTANEIISRAINNADQYASTIVQLGLANSHYALAIHYYQRSDEYNKAYSEEDIQQMFQESGLVSYKCSPQELLASNAMQKLHKISNSNKSFNYIAKKITEVIEITCYKIIEYDYANINPIISMALARFHLFLQIVVLDDSKHAVFSAESELLIHEIMIICIELNLKYNAPVIHMDEFQNKMHDEFFEVGYIAQHQNIESKTWMANSGLNAICLSIAVATAIIQNTSKTDNKPQFYEYDSTLYHELNEKMIAEMTFLHNNGKERYQYHIKALEDLLQINIDEFGSLNIKKYDKQLRRYPYFDEAEYQKLLEVKDTHKVREILDTFDYPIEIKTPFPKLLILNGSIMDGFTRYTTGIDINSKISDLNSTGYLSKDYPVIIVMDVTNSPQKTKLSDESFNLIEEGKIVIILARSEQKYGELGFDTLQGGDLQVLAHQDIFKLEALVDIYEQNKIDFETNPEWQLLALISSGTHNKHKSRNFTNGEKFRKKIDNLDKNQNKGKIGPFAISSELVTLEFLIDFNVIPERGSFGIGGGPLYADNRISAGSGHAEDLNIDIEKCNILIRLARQYINMPYVFLDEIKKMFRQRLIEQLNRYFLNINNNAINELSHSELITLMAHISIAQRVLSYDDKLRIIQLDACPIDNICKTLIKNGLSIKRKLGGSNAMFVIITDIIYKIHKMRQDFINFVPQLL